MRGIIRVDNDITQEVYIGSTNDMDKYVANVMKYRNSGKTPPHRWVIEYGLGAMRVSLLEEMTEYDFQNVSFVNSKKKQWYHHLLKVEPDIKLVNDFDKEKKKEGKTKIQYNGAYEDIMMKLGEIENALVRVEEKIDAK